MKILFVGFAVSDEAFEELRTLDPRVGVAAHKLQWNIIRGIESASGSVLDIISSYPISDFPGGRKFLVWGHPWKHRPEASDRILSHVNVVLAKHVTRLASALYEELAWSWKNRDERSRVTIVYALHSPHVLASIIQKLAFGGRVVVIVPDLPEYMDVSSRRNRLRRLAKPLDALLIKSLLSQVDGLVVLTRQMADILPSVPSVMTLEGMVSEEADVGVSSVSQVAGSPTSSEQAPMVIVYAGILSEAYGVDLLMDALAFLPRKGIVLRLFGAGELEGEIRSRAAMDSRLEFRGRVSNVEVLKEEAAATVLVNARRSGSEYTAYSFPSKLLEYLSSGTPVVSTRLRGIPDEYFDHLLALDEESPKALAECLMRFRERPLREQNAIGAAGQKFVRSQKNWRTQGIRLFNFVEGVVNRGMQEPGWSNK